MKTSRLLTVIGLIATTWLTACDTYYDDMQQMGERTEVLETKVLEANTALETLGEIITVIEQQGYVSSVTQNADGTTTISFSTGKTFTLRPGRQGTDGRDGADVSMSLSVSQDETDGLWYWTMNGDWLLDANGQRMRAGASDGKDGRDGHDGKSASETGAIVPQLRINTITRHWEISTDGGSSWTDTGVSADGKDGKNGQNGNKGQDDLFVAINIAPNGKSITFVLRDGRTFTVPIQ